MFDTRVFLSSPDTAQRNPGDGRHCCPSFPDFDVRLSWKTGTVVTIHHDVQQDTRFV